MTKITFYPLGNADTTLVQLQDERAILIDYCHKEEGFDLKEALKTYLKDSEKNDFDIVAFTHADKDHVSGMEDFFWLEYAKQYQSKERPKVKELWVPAVMVTEPGLSGSAAVIQKETSTKSPKQASHYWIWFSVFRRTSISLAERKNCKMQ